MLEKGPIISILIPDGENELLTNHVKDCFSKEPLIRLFVMSAKKMAPSCFSRYVYKYSYYPKTKDELQWIANINKEVLRNQIDLVMPIFEDGIRSLIKLKEYLDTPEKLVVHPSLEMFTIANNKVLLAKHMLRNNIPAPKIYHLKKDGYQEFEEHFFPILAKPIDRTDGGSGIVLLKNNDEVSDFLFNNTHLGDFLFQEYIEGYDIDCSVLCNKGNIKAFTIQKGILYGVKKFAPPIGVQFIFEEDLLKSIEKLMKTLNYSGVAHVDLRFDQNDGEFKVIEVNTRFWGSLDASLFAGVNFPYLYALVSLNETFERPNYDFIEYSSLAGVYKRFKKNSGIAFDLGYLWKYSALKLIIKDPMPFLIKIFLSLKSHIVYFLEENRIKRSTALVV